MRYLCYSLFIVASISTTRAVDANELRWYLLQKKTKELNICRAFKLLRARGIEPILIKGWAAARYYPKDVPRHYNDLDLAVSADDFVVTEGLAISEEFIGLTLDVHRELRHLDTLPWDNLFSNSMLVDLEGTSVRVLRPEDHLRVLCVHWLTDGGAHKDKLWDIYYAVHNRAPDFDWERCLGTVSDRRRRWVLYTIGIANRYLGLEIDDLPFAEKARNFPIWMIKVLEKEWRRHEFLQPVTSFLRQPSALLSQLARRVPPNPIRATIEMEGDLGGSRRPLYQFASMVRMAPSLAFAAKVMFKTARRAR
jgi:hypothetical protein